MKQTILSHLPGDHPWQNQIHYMPSIDSTNLEARRKAAEGAPHGSVYIAQQQTAGRGRLGRSFQSPSNMGIYMSILIRPNCHPEKLMHLTCITAVALCDALEQTTGFRPGIKWTNDLVANKRKIAGVLTELSIDPHSGIIDYAIIGLGINCYQQSTDFPEELREIAGSLYMVTNARHSREKIIAEIIAEIFQCIASDSDKYMSRYRKDCVTIDSDICLVRGNEIRYGHAIDIDDQGALIIEFPNGTRETVNSGEVSVRGMYGYQ